MDLTSEAEVLVVGAGPTGLTAAIELAMRGIHVRIIDMVPPRPPNESRALGTNARSQEIFERQGSLARMQQIGVPMRGFSFFTRHKRVARISFERLDSFYPAMLHLRQAETEQALIDRLAELGVTVERPIELAELSQDEKAVYATLTRPDGSRDVLTIAYLIGADGARSRVRKSLGLEFAAQFSGEREYLADVKVEWRGETRALVEGITDSIFFVDGSPAVGFGPLASGRYRAIISARPGDIRFEQPQPSLNDLQQLVDAAGVDARLYDLSWVSSFTQSARKIDQLRHGRIFLAGDAAHIHSPFGGQGMNTGVSDAVNLSWKLAFRLRGIGSESLLDSYHAERNPILEQLLKVASGGVSFFSGDGAFTNLLRGPALRIATRLGPVQSVASRWLAGYTNNYRESPIIESVPAQATGRFGRRQATVKVGDRAPDASDVLVKGQPRRLFEVWACEPRHILLVFASNRATPDRQAALQVLTQNVSKHYGSLIQPYIVQAPGSAAQEGVLIDSTGELRKRYGGHTERLYLVRPDGYVGFHSQPADFAALQRYMRRVFSV